jgi:hypothetical protein
MNTRLTRLRRARLTRALEASEYPEQLISQNAVLAVRRLLRAAERSLRHSEGARFRGCALQVEIERRMQHLAARYDEIRELDRRAIVAQLMALGVLGHAAGYAVHPCDRDIARDPNTIRGTGPFESA